MQIWCAEGNNHGVCVSHGGDKRGAVSPCCNVFVYTEGAATPTESEYLLKKLIVVFLMNMK